MQLTLHLTNRCNLNCSYCFVDHGNESMTREIAFAAVRLGMQGVKTSGLLFYGGEPLLERQLIYDTVEYSQSLRKKTGHNFYYKMTTNGMLLDGEFLDFAKIHNLTIGFSHDGPSQDDCRLTKDGQPTFAHLQDKIPLLLKYQPYAIGMSVTDPSTVHKAADMMRFLHDSGFKYLHISHNYDRKAPWTPEVLEILRGEYAKMAEMYIEWTKAEEKFYLSPIDAKVLSHLKGEKYNLDRIRMSMNQPSVDTDGSLYYSSRYLGEEAFKIGDVFAGVNEEKRAHILKYAYIPPENCRDCAILNRCNYAYDSLVCASQADTSAALLEYTADVNPVQCAHEQLLTPLADYAAETLYNADSALFIQKHYNELYPIMSLVEDISARR